jgi:hypothetical protein
MFASRLTPLLLLAAWFVSIGAKPITEHAQGRGVISSISQAATPAATDQGAGCPVTRAPSQPFVPPPPYPRQTSPSGFWFGDQVLWTELPTSGTWSLGHYRPTDAAFRQKLLWWRRGYDWRTQNPPNLVVTGRRLDSASPPLAPDDHANAGWTEDQNHPFMVTGIEIPTAGCWQITGDYRGDKLTFVVLVKPREK